MRCDLIVVGSGPCGAQAAKEAVEAGLDVVMLDVGFDDDSLEKTIPYAPFSTLRRTDHDQRRYLLGDDGDTEGTTNDRIGAHFTPPRAYIKRGVESYVPVLSDTFFPELSLALGGLGAGWGSGTQIFEPFELRRAGLPVEEMTSFYNAVSDDIGISGAVGDDTAELTLPAGGVQPPAELDTNCASLFAAYGRKKRALNARGFLAGRVSMAMLTEETEEKRVAGRHPNPYFDMDFYANFDRSIYRPKYTIEELASRPNFTYVKNALVESFETPAGGPATVLYRDISTGSFARMECRKLLLAANPLNSARIVLHARRAYGAKQPLLCNPYHYVPAINLRMLGREAADRRHSMGQIIALYRPGHREGESVLGAFCSYRSLLHFRLVREMPLPVPLGLLVSRVLQNSLTVVGIHHPERRSERKWVRLAEGPETPRLEAHYELGEREAADVDADMRGMLGCLRTLGCVPFSVLRTPPGSSIHYAGTLPFSGDGEASVSCESDGRLIGSPNVYIADSSTWRYLPAKGPTLTIMANGRRVARNAALAIAAGR